MTRLKLKRLTKIALLIALIAFAIILPRVIHNFRYFATAGMGEGNARRLLAALHERELLFKQKNNRYSLDIEELEFTPDSIKQRFPFWSHNVIGFKAVAVHRVFDRLGIFTIDETGVVTVVESSVPEFSYFRQKRRRA